MPRRTKRPRITPRQRLEWRLEAAQDVHRVARYALGAALCDGHHDVHEAAQRVLVAARWDVTLCAELLRRVDQGEVQP